MKVRPLLPAEADPAAVLPRHLARRVVVTPEGHWLLAPAWRGKTRAARQSRGYACIGKPGQRGRSVLWHRYCRERADGCPLQPGEIVLHEDAVCRERDCGAPGHTTRGTVAENNARCRQQGRWRGPHGAAKPRAAREDR